MTESQLKPHFVDAHTPSSRIVISEEIRLAYAQASQKEAADKEDRLRRFYDDIGWKLAPMALDYLFLFKEQSSVRKDGITSSRIHELDPLLMLKAHLEAEILPERVTSYFEDGIEKKLPPAHQSIEHLFIAIAIHDTDEDYADASVKDFTDYMNARIDLLDLSEDENAALKFSVLYDAESLKALTFGHKTHNKEGEIITETTHNGDLNTYLCEIERHWPAVVAKGLDRLGGLVTRFGPDIAEEFFTVQQHMEFLNETYLLFMNNQPLEKSMKRYPELSDHISIINEKIDVSYRCMHAVVHNHPDYMKTMHRPKYNPATAVIEISDRLYLAIKDANCLDSDVKPLQRMLMGFLKLAEIHPSLRNLVSQIDRQINDAFRKYTPSKAITTLGSQTTGSALFALQTAPRNIDLQPGT